MTIGWSCMPPWVILTDIIKNSSQANSYLTGLGLHISNDCPNNSHNDKHTHHNMHLVVHSPATPPALSKHASGGLPHWPLHLHQNINLLIRHSGSISSYLIHCHKSHPWDSVVRHRACIHWTSRKWLAHCLLGGIHSLAHHNLMLPQHEICKYGATSSSQNPSACRQRAGASSTGQTHYHVC